MAKQKDAVYNAIVAVKGTSTFSGQVELTPEERKQVQKSLFSDFKNGQVDYSGDLTNDGKLTVYISGLVSNWLRKDTRLNGGTTYTPANPGSRAGQGDDMLKAMRDLQAIAEGDEAREAIQKEIDKRLAEIRPKPEIDINAIPDSLRHLLPKH